LVIVHKSYVNLVLIDNTFAGVVTYISHVHLDSANIGAYALGCAILSAGGGGDPAIGVAMARHAVTEAGPVDVVDVDDLDSGALIMPCGLIGSPTVAQERVWNGREVIGLARAIERVTGSAVEAVMCYEIAGVNGLLPVTWAARLGRPLVDADGMGRAFPEMQQQAMHLAGVPASPVVLTDGRDNVLVIDATDNLEAERLARRCAATLGGTCAGALYPMTAGTAATSTIRGSVATALRIGSALSACDGGWPEVLAEEAAGRVLIEGKVSDVVRQPGIGFSRGHAIVAGMGEYAGRLLRLEMQNEVLLALEDGRVRACVPDIIAVLGLDNGRPVGTERLHYGQRVAVIALPGADVWRSDDALRVVGPGAFGYDVDPMWTGTEHAG
jgi:DUF917 family protein